jgi:hypothetical protein
MNPIIFLWAHPRSMSTAIERIMRERGDFDCLHEPFLRYYYLRRTGKPLPHFDDAQDHPCSYEETREMILERAAKAPVFAKDMSYYVMPEILRDEAFCRRLRHCFLIRNPMHSILSYYRLDPYLSLQEVGLEMQWRHFEGLQALGIDNSIVMEAEVVQRDSSTSMRRFWRALGLDDKPQALNWDQDSTPEDWDYVQGWHQSVGASSGIRAPAADEARRKQAEFDRLCQQAPQLAEYLDHHLPFYRRLRERSLSGSADEQ